MCITSLENFEAITKVQELLELIFDLDYKEFANVLWFKSKISELECLMLDLNHFNNC